MGVCECVRVCMGVYAWVCTQVFERVCGCQEDKKEERVNVRERERELMLER